MTVDLPLFCRCGHVRGLASGVLPSSGCRVVCYCRDCQAFARFLAHAPMQGPNVLNGAGGTDIFQMPPARVKLTAGTDAVHCLRLSSKGILRWYADCCRTPIGNTVGPRFPMIGVIHSFTDHAADGRSLDEALGPPICRIYERSAVRPLPPDAPAPASFAVIAGRGLAMLGWWWRGLARPNPFFDAHSGAPLSAPRVLTAGERAAL
jgi:Family of unknown function (DUF6151)